MTGFKPGSSGIGSDRSANCATTTAHLGHFLVYSTGIHVTSKWINNFDIHKVECCSFPICLKTSLLSNTSPRFFAAFGK